MIPLVKRFQKEVWTVAHRVRAPGIKTQQAPAVTTLSFTEELFEFPVRNYLV